MNPQEYVLDVQDATTTTQHKQDVGHQMSQPPTLHSQDVGRQMSQPVHRLGSFGVHHGESEQTGLKLISSKFIKKVMYCLLGCQHKV